MVLLVALVVVGCGQTVPSAAVGSRSDGPAAPASGVFAASATAAPPPSLPRGRTVRLTGPPSSGLVRLHLGDRLVVQLSAKHHWAIGMGDDSMVVRLRGAQLPRGAQAAFLAAKPGLTTLFVTDLTPCASGCSSSGGGFTVNLFVASP
jgi:hypothetical protein